jgi:malonyl CoA-acyl carrier protein transacylase
MKPSSPATEPNPEIVVFVVPGIGISYMKSVNELLGNPVFKHNCFRAGIFEYPELKPPALDDYSLSLEDTLQNQKLSYVVNCTMSDLYNEGGVFPDIIIGYSMGIYAALYAGGYYSFDTGLSIVEMAYQLVEKKCSGGTTQYGMGIILGLKENELRALLFSETGNCVDIAVRNGKRSFVIAGERAGVEYCLKKAPELGAFGARPILTGHPYHFRALSDIAEEFSAFLETLHFTSPRADVLSLVDGNVITKNEISRTIVRAMYQPLSFDRAVHYVTKHYSMGEWYETGPEKSMSKLLKYINRKAKIFHYSEENG